MTITFPRTPALRVRSALGLASVAGALVATTMALLWSPPDANQGDVFRIIYVHVPSALTAYLAFVVVFVASIGWLWARRPIWDAIAASAAELGVLFAGLTLVSGSIWARPTWGVWWSWEPRLTLTAVMFVMYVGYLLLRSLSTDLDRRATRAAVLGIVAVVNVPIVHFAVTWWNSLHPLATVLRPGGSPGMEDRMLATYVVSLLAFALIFAWAMTERVAIELARQRRMLEAREA